MAPKNTKKSKTPNIQDKSVDDSFYLSKRTIADMITKGVGHTNMKKILNNLNKDA